MLQFHAAVCDGENTLDIPDNLVCTIKEKAVFLATDPNVNPDIQSSAQNFLKTGMFSVLHQVWYAIETMLTSRKFTL